MPEQVKPVKIGSRTAIINKDASLADGARAAGDVTTGTKGNATHVDLHLTVQFDTTAPNAGDIIGEVYLLPGDGEGSEKFPEGGDGTVGNDVDPQNRLHIGTFESRVPSNSADEDLVIPNVPLGVGTDRFVYKNLSGQTMDQTWQLDGVFKTLESVTV